MRSRKVKMVQPESVPQFVSHDGHQVDTAIIELESELLGRTEFQLRAVAFELLHIQGNSAPLNFGSCQNQRKTREQLIIFEAQLDYEGGVLRALQSDNLRRYHERNPFGLVLVLFLRNALTLLGICAVRSIDVTHRDTV